MATATLRLTRKWGGVVWTRPYKVSVDGAMVGSIAARETQELPVEPGHHEVQVGTGRHISPARAFDVGEGDVATFWCRGAMLWPVYLASVFKPDLWITLQQG